MTASAFRRTWTATLLIAFGSLFAGPPTGTAAAQTIAAEAGEGASGSTPGLFLELNTLQQVNTACRMVFMAENTLGGDLTGVSFETVLVNTDGVVNRLTVFDFKELPKDRPRVRQFDLDNTQCDTIGRVLINGAASCEGDGLKASDCIDKLSVSSRTEVEISG